MNHHRHTYLIIFIAAVLLLLAAWPVRGQQRFTVIVDTVLVNDLTPYNKLSEASLINIKKYRDYYFCELHELDNMSVFENAKLGFSDRKDECGFPVAKFFDVEILTSDEDKADSIGKLLEEKFHDA